MPKKHRIFLVSWLLLPLFLVWFSTNYLLGLHKTVAWKNPSASAGVNNQPSIIATQSAVLGAQVQPYPWNGQALLSLWFDDGWESQFTVAYPFLEAQGFVGALAIPTGSVGWDAFMSWNQVLYLAQKGWEITSHTRSHSCKASDIADPNYVETELKGSLDDIEAHGIAVKEFVTPCGAGSPIVDTVAKKYYLALRTADGGYNPIPVDNPYHLVVQTVLWQTSIQEVNDWIKTAQKTHTWLILTFHQIQANASDYAVSPDKFKQIIDAVAHSGINVVLPKYALAAYDATGNVSATASALLNATQSAAN